MDKLKLSDVVLLNFPFTDGKTFKKRYQEQIVLEKLIESIFITFISKVIVFYSENTPSLYQEFLIKIPKQYIKSFK